VSAIPYDGFFSVRTRYAATYPRLLNLPIREQPYEYLRKAVAESGPHSRVLDFGCGVAKVLQRVLQLDDTRYHSCDADLSGSYTYASVADIPADARYEFVTANQVFEHMSFDAAVTTAAALSRHVSAGGIFAVSVPNPQHPSRQLSNPTHITPWDFLSLCALLDLAGLEVVLIARTGMHCGVRWWKRPIVRMVAETFRMDWCDTLFVVGKRAL
jgi:SAM-dependent methyltransferase